MTINSLSCCLIWYLFWRSLSIIKSLMRRGSLTSVAECFPWQESVLSDDFRCVCLFSSEMIWQRSTNPANYRHTASQSRSCIQPSIIDSYCVLMCGVKIYVKNIFCKLYHFSSCLLAKFPSCMFQLGLSDNGVPKLGCPCPYVSHEIIIWGRYTPISSRTNSFLVPRCSQRQKSNFWLSINYHSISQNIYHLCADVSQLPSEKMADLRIRELWSLRGATPAQCVGGCWISP